MVDKEAVEEAERLLEDEEKRPQAESRHFEEKVTWRKLPHKKQLFLLSLCRLSTPLSNACLLPYVYHLVKSILSDPDHPSAPQQIARLTGLLVAAYPLGQVTTSILWGKVSDNYGRKPVILTGLAISIVANLAFGFSQTIGTLLFWRVLAGMANGIVGVMRTMTAEIVKDKRHQTRAFLAPPVVFNSGRVAALAVGGCLADPIINLPSLFGPSGILNVSVNSEGVAWASKFPYALPAIFNGTVLAACLLSASLGLRETLPTKEKSGGLGITMDKSMAYFLRERTPSRVRSRCTAVRQDNADVVMLDVSAPELPSPRPSTSAGRLPGDKPRRSIGIWTKHLLKILLAFGLLPLHNSTFLHIFPVFLSMPGVTNIKYTAFYFVGGLGLPSPTVGLYLALFGICGIFLQLFIYPRIQHRIGTLGAFRLSSAIFPLAYLFAPYLALLSQDAVAKWPAMAAVLFLQVLARTMAFPSSVILLTNAAPRKSVLGTVHGAGNTVSALASAGGPVIGGMLLARGIEKGAVGTVWWFWLLTVALVSLGWTFYLDNEEEGREERCMGDV